MACLGTESDPPVDTHFIPKLRAGDNLLVCSDGVWHYYTDVELGEILCKLSAREATEFLIEKARNRGRGGGARCRNFGSLGGEAGGQHQGEKEDRGEEWLHGKVGGPQPGYG